MSGRTNGVIRLAATASTVLSSRLSVTAATIGYDRIGRKRQMFRYIYTISRVARSVRVGEETNETREWLDRGVSQGGRAAELGSYHPQLLYQPFRKATGSLSVTSFSRQISYPPTEDHGASLGACVGDRTNRRCCGSFQRNSEFCQRYSEIKGSFPSKCGHFNHSAR